MSSFLINPYRFSVSGSNPLRPWVIGNNVSLLLHGEGADDSTTFTDSSLNAFTVTRTNSARIKTDNFKHGSAAIFFPTSSGNGDSALNVSYNAALDLVGSDFTIAGWVRRSTTFTSGLRIFSTGGGTVAWNATSGIHMLLQFIGSSQNLDFQIASGTATPRSFTGSLATASNTWHFITACLASNTVYLGVDGTVQSSSLSAPSRPSTNPSVRLGAIPGESLPAPNIFAGYMDELLIVKGEALYTSNFTPPSGPFENP
jgi:hypothetical protein